MVGTPFSLGRGKTTKAETTKEQWGGGQLGKKRDALKSLQKALAGKKKEVFRFCMVKKKEKRKATLPNKGGGVFRPRTN